MDRIEGNVSEAKTKPTDVDVESYLSGIADQRKVADSRVLIEMMSEVTGEPATMWGPSMIGFGFWHYVGKSGSHGDWFLVGFAPRTAAFSLYLTWELEPLAEELAKLGKYKAGKGCLYVKRLSDIDLDVLRGMIVKSVELTRKRAEGRAAN